MKKLLKKKKKETLRINVINYITKICCDVLRLQSAKLMILFCIQLICFFSFKISLIADIPSFGTECSSKVKHIFKGSVTSNSPYTERTMTKVYSSISPLLSVFAFGMSTCRSLLDRVFARNFGNNINTQRLNI